MRTIYFITRTLPEGNSGGALIRRGQIFFLQKRGYKVVIVAPGPHTILKEDRIIIEYNSGRFSFLYNVILSYFRIKCDYLAKWAEVAIDILEKVVTSKDIVLATSGGEMGTLYLASILKKKTGCRAILNLHDPIVHTLLDGEYSYKSKYPVPSRDSSERTIFENADNIVTSSQYYCDYLKNKYRVMAEKFSCHHFGFINMIEKPQENCRMTKRINVIYGGNMGQLQGPEILVEVAKLCTDVDFIFVGNVSFNIPLGVDNVRCLPMMKYEDYVEYMIENADIGFFSLKGSISKWCVPSKLYEYINAGIPVLAAVQGDARKIIIENEYGYACDYDVEQIAHSLRKMQNSGILHEAKRNILSSRNKWYMGNTIDELVGVIDKNLG